MLSLGVAQRWRLGLARGIRRGVAVTKSPSTAISQRRGLLFVFICSLAFDDTFASAVRQSGIWAPAKQIIWRQNPSQNSRITTLTSQSPRSIPSQFTPGRRSRNSPRSETSVRWPLWPLALSRRLTILEAPQEGLHGQAQETPRLLDPRLHLLGLGERRLRRQAADRDDLHLVGSRDGRILRTCPLPPAFPRT